MEHFAAFTDLTTTKITDFALLHFGIVLVTVAYKRMSRAIRRNHRIQAIWHHHWSVHRGHRGSVENCTVGKCAII